MIPPEEELTGNVWTFSWKIGVGVVDEMKKKESVSQCRKKRLENSWDTCVVEFV